VDESAVVQEREIGQDEEPDSALDQVCHIAIEWPQQPSRRLHPAAGTALSSLSARGLAFMHWCTCYSPFPAWTLRAQEIMQRYEAMHSAKVGEERRPHTL
jgi:hypothetical protein